MHHEVKQGENLSIIARRYGISVIIILRRNPHLRKRRHHIYVGEKIKIQ